jgi:hypothetical protein
MIALLDVPIDRLSGDLPPRIVGEIPLHAAFDLIRRPAPPEAIMHVLAYLAPPHLSDPRAVPALVALPLSSDRTILAPATATRDTVAPDLTRNGCFITPQPLGNLPLGTFSDSNRAISTRSSNVR